MTAKRLNPEYQAKGDYVPNMNTSDIVFTMNYRYAGMSWSTDASIKTICRNLLNNIAVSSKHAVEIGIMDASGRHVYIAHAYNKGTGNLVYGMVLSYMFTGEAVFYCLNNSSDVLYTLNKTQR